MRSADGDWSWMNADGGRRLGYMHARAAALRAVRAFFDGRDYIEVETPLMVPSPGLDVHLSAFEVAGAKDARWLITSPEYQMKRLVSAGMGRIYQLARCFRRDEVGSHHEPEFTMLEWYRASASSEDLMQETEALVASIARALHGSTNTGFAGHRIDLATPWPRLTVRDAFSLYAGVAMDDVVDDEERFSYPRRRHRASSGRACARVPYALSGIDGIACSALCGRCHDGRPIRGIRGRRRALQRLR